MQWRNETGGAVGSTSLGSTFLGRVCGIFGHRCPENVDSQLFKINIWLIFCSSVKECFKGVINVHSMIST